MDYKAYSETLERENAELKETIKRMQNDVERLHREVTKQLTELESDHAQKLKEANK